MTQETIQEYPLLTTLEKKEVFKQNIKDRVLEGRLNPLEFYRQAKIAGDCIEELKKDADILSCAQDERARYGKEKPSINGSIVDTGSKTTYDFKSCNDPVWNELKEKISEREKLLKALPPEGMADPSTGGIIMPPTSKVSNFITVKI
jgi:hypothetical protein